MVWARFDDRYSESHKVLEAGPWAELLDMRGIIYCCRNETDGVITTAALTRISTGIPSARKKAERLVEVGRWEPREHGGWQIHDFLTYNPSHASLEEQRAEGKKRAARSRSVRANQRPGSADPRGRAQAGQLEKEDVSDRARPTWAVLGYESAGAWMAAGRPEPVPEQSETGT